MDLRTKSQIWAIFGLTCMYKKLRNLRIVPPGVTNLVSKCVGNLKKKVIERRGESISRCGVIMRNVEGGGGLLGPPVFLGLMKGSWYHLHQGFSISLLEGPHLVSKISNVPLSNTCSIAAWVSGAHFRAPGGNWGREGGSPPKLLNVRPFNGPNTAIIVKKIKYKFNRMWDEKGK